MMDLQGKRILVTRAKAQASALSSQIKGINGIPIEIPLITCKPVVEKKAIHNAINSIHNYEWLVFTSKNGIDFFFQEWNDLKKSIVVPTSCKIAVVGKKTKETLEAYGLQADLVPELFVAESLLESLLKVVKRGECVLISRGNLARNIIPDRLKSAGINVTELDVYETDMESNSKEKLIHLIKEKEIDVITFTSSSTVDHFIHLLKGTSWREVIGHIIFASIGPITTKTMKKHRLPVHIEPEEYTIQGMLRSIADKLKEDY